MNPKQWQIDFLIVFSKLLHYCDEIINTYYNNIYNTNP